MSQRAIKHQSRADKTNGKHTARQGIAKWVEAQNVPPPHAINLTHRFLTSKPDNKQTDNGNYQSEEKRILQMLENIG